MLNHSYKWRSSFYRDFGSNFGYFLGEARLCFGGERVRKSGDADDFRSSFNFLDLLFNLVAMISLLGIAAVPPL